MKPPLPASGLTDHLGYWLRFVSNHVSQGFARKVEAHGVTVAEWVLMRQLFDVDALAPSRLAGRVGMTRGAVTKLADRLIAKSLLARTADPQDGRAQTLALTARGRGLVPQLAALADANDKEFFDRLAPKDRAVLLRILRGIVETRGLKSLPVD
ncbi:MAG TPA: MarR family transcriptional regulator [Rhizomicrobium sp.]|jgi:DNA-binding MarR family transcriptional regulator|nr:MarR family transcriptional regulator [Rhizomicrobium sp.]